MRGGSGSSYANYRVVQQRNDYGGRNGFFVCNDAGDNCTSDFFVASEDLCRLVVASEPLRLG